MVRAQGVLDDIRVALVHDYFTQWGGAERVALTIGRMFQRVTIFALVADPAVVSSFRELDVRTSWLQELYFGGARPLHLLPLFPVAASSLRLDEFDLVITSSSAFAHGARSQHAARIDYVYNTMRFAWDYANYVRDYPVPGLVKALGTPLARELRHWDRRAAGHPGRVVGISTEVKARIQRHWGIGADVVFPPAAVDDLPIEDDSREHFLVVTRLIPYKRVEIAILAANLLGQRLIVCGQGPDLRRLQGLAGPTVQFAGWVDERTKRILMRRAKAVVVPAAEDYGLVPVEANGLGSPVVAFNAGGVRDTQVDGVTGRLVSEDSPEAFGIAMNWVAGRKWDRTLLARHARQFGLSAFRRSFLSLVAQELHS